MYRVTTPEHVFKLPEDASVTDMFKKWLKQGSHSNPEWFDRG